MISERAKGYHSFTFNDEVNTWDDWGVVSVKRSTFSTPETKVVYIDIPGSDGSLDFTEVLTGVPTYQNRVGTIPFFIYKAARTADTTINSMINYLHGKRVRVVRTDEPDFYYEGRFQIKNYRHTSEGEWGVFDLEYNLEPYKYELFSSLEPWKWDPFNFETGIIRNYADLPVNGTFTLEIMGRRMNVVPEFIVTDSPSGLDVTFRGTGYHLDEGKTRNVNIQLGEGMNTLVFTGNGKVSVDYRGGSL